MKKFIVETYYTCTFKTVHTLNELNDQELAKIDERKDGKVEVIEVKLNNRKTKKVGEKTKIILKIFKKETVPENIIKAVKNNDNSNINNSDLNKKIKEKLVLDLKCLIEEKAIFKKLK